MAVEVGGGDQGSLRSKWLRGLWVADRKSFSISIDSPFLPEVAPQRHLIEEETVYKSRSSKRVAPKPKKTESSGTPPALLENKLSDVVVEATSGATCPRRNSKKSDASERHMIPLKNLTASAVAPPIVVPRARKSSERRAKVFHRAYSCDLDNSTVDVISEKSTRACRSLELEMTRVEAKPNKTTDALLLLESPSAEGSKIASGELKDSERDAGIVCSDEDLHSILSEITHSRRLSAEVKREKMKSNRSLSLDSSFFKLHMKRLQADSPAWLARILNQRDRKETDGCAVDGSVEPGACGELLRKKSISKKPETAPATISEDTSSAEGDLSSRRESTVSGSDDECSLLLVNNSESIVQGNANPSVVVNDHRTLASRVVWNESSVVDAEVLGHAIEFYLTTATGKRASVDECLCQTLQASSIIADVPTPGSGDACVPVMSSLKSLFV